MNNDQPIDPELIHIDQPASAEDNKENEWAYFVSYKWDTKKQTGTGCLELKLSNKISSYEDVKAMINWLEKNVKDQYGYFAKCIIINYILISEPSPTIKGEEEQEALWNEVVAKVATADIVQSVRPADDVSKLVDWKKKVIEQLKSKYSITRKK